MITCLDLADDDEDGALLRQHFEELQSAAAAAGHSLTRTTNGFVLRTGTHSRHSDDLKTIATLLKVPNDR